MRRCKLRRLASRSVATEAAAFATLSATALGENTDSMDEQGGVLFADICDSVRLYEQHGSTAGVRIAEQSMQRMQQITESHGGQVIRLQGDGVKSLFPTVDAAYDAALEMQQAHRQSPCAIKVAFSFGALLRAQDDVFGDVVHLASRLLSFARPGEILLTGKTAGQLSKDRGINTRLLATTHVKGMAAPVELFTVIEDIEDENTTAASLTRIATGQPLSNALTLVLKYAGEQHTYHHTLHALTIGRSSSCDIVATGDYASRLHARIELARNHFVLSDLSTNGTYVINQDSECVLLKRESVQLIGTGRISLGRPPGDQAEDVLQFHHESF